MLAGRKIAVVVAIVVIGAGGAVWLWSRGEPALVPGDPDAPGRVKAKWDDSYGGFSNAGIYFLSVGPKETLRQPAQDVWKSLLASMAADAGTRALLRRLYNDLPTDFVVLPAKAAQEMDTLGRAAGPPGAGFAVVLRVAGEQPLREVSGGGLHGSLGCRRDVRVKSGDRSADFIEKDGPRPPHDLTIILFAMNDYLLRTKTAYYVFDAGPSSPQGIRMSGEYPLQDLDAMRVHLDGQIAKYLEGYRASPK